MTNRELLEKCIERSGLKKGFIADAIGKDPSVFSKKLAGTRDFTESEMKVLARVLQLSDAEKIAIFFAEAVDKMATA